MNILDFPPEIFEEIITHYVEGTHITQCWKARGVNAVFKSFIDKEFFARQPTSFFASNGSRRYFLKMNTALYLQYRCKIRHTEEDLLPKFVKRAIDICMDAEEEETVARRDELTRLACDYFGGRSSGSFRIIMKPSNKSRRVYSTEHDKSHCLALAIDMGDKALVQYLTSNGASMWHENPVFSNMLRLVACSGNIELVRCALDAAERDGFDYSRWLRDRSLSKIVYNEPHVTSAIRDTMILWYLGVFKQVTASTCVQIFDFAINTHQRRILKALLDDSDNCKILRRVSEQLASIAQPARLGAKVLTMLIEKRMIDANRRFITHVAISRYGYGSDEMCVLDYAVFLKDVNLVRAILDAGANPNGKANDLGQLSSPLSKAIHDEHVEIVKVLLDAGANPDREYHHVSSGTLAGKHIAAHLENARRVRAERMRNPVPLNKPTQPRAPANGGKMTPRPAQVAPRKRKGD